MQNINNLIECTVISSCKGNCCTLRRTEVERETKVAIHRRPRDGDRWGPKPGLYQWNHSIRGELPPLSNELHVPVRETGCAGPSGTAEAAQRGAVLPAADAAATDQQCPATKPGCSTTGHPCCQSSVQPSRQQHLSDHKHNSHIYECNHFWGRGRNQHPRYRPRLLRDIHYKPISAAGRKRGRTGTDVSESENPCTVA